ncbi:RNA polymerase sigma factor [Chromatiaceae bacterium AAb-1]|nr:RNA polymerase sigma factor [Chromatiaceae bacterium AAb-1]
MSVEIAAAIRSAQKGNRQAFYQLYRQFIGRVYAISWRLLADKQKAEDACQETFIKIWQQLPGFRGDSNFATWLHSIATRTAIDVWRQDKLLRLTDSDDPDGMPVAEITENQDLEQAIQRLPARARAVFVLFALEGYQHQEIAELLGIAEGSSKAQYHRARQLLKEWLSED